MMKKLLIGFLFICLFSQPVLAINLYQYSVKSEIFENNTVYYNINLILENDFPGSFNYLIEGNPYSIEYESKGKCRIQERILGKELICYFNKDYNITKIKISYFANNKIEKRKNYFLYKDSLNFPYNTKDFFYLVKIPEGTGLIKGNENFFPENASLGSDGRRAVLYWKLNNTTKGNIFETRVAYEPLSEFNYSVLIIPFIVIIFLIVIIIFMKKHHSKIILPILKEDEKKIYEVLLKHGSGIKQKIIVQESGYSKAKVSKVLKNLQERGIVKLERLGRTNKVYLSNKFKNREK
ncbi:MAG: winged helix-turn-helix transcriptional regulator [Candidatus Aenigmarchaeota archaeon]|nr:winged helix-turn-helix transcriptional regulator [Candidatus Aenigmarchaeota archaeon]